MPSYRTNGTCSKEIIFEVKDNKLILLKFINGCSGNLQGIARLSLGQDIDYLISTLKGIHCKGNTSCPDQLARALIAFKEKQQEEQPK